MAEPSILGALRDPQFRSDTLRNLVEALNGAKRSLTVGSLGAAGDMGNTLANLVRAGAGTAYHEATGRPIPQALEYRDPARDFGTSASLGNFAERQGWLPPQTFSMPEQAGALLGPIVAMKAPDLAQSTLRGLVSALKSEPSRRMVEGYMGGMGMKPQAIVWHGSPHQFDAFDSSKIGTGEGAQAYGHGLYLAEAPTVASGYQNRLSTGYVRPDGSLQSHGDPWQSAYDAIRAQKPMPHDHATAIASQVQDWVDSGKKAETFLRYNKPPAGFEASYKSAVDAFASVKKNPGSLYKVDLPDPLIARMLDWDKPLSQQAPEVIAALEKSKNKQVKAMLDYAKAPYSKLSGAEGEAKTMGSAYHLMSMNLSGKTSADSAKASQLLHKQGIPGIRYLDGGSRADGAGTSNFVVFPGEESALTILERNGKPVRSNHAPITPDDVTEARFIERLHAPRDQQKLNKLTADMKKNGWTGRPLLAYEDGNGIHAITGSHRLTAAKNTNTPVPYILVDDATLVHENEHGQSISDFIGNDDFYLGEFLKNAGDKRAAYLMSLENKDGF